MLTLLKKHISYISLQLKNCSRSNRREIKWVNILVQCRLNKSSQFLEKLASILITGYFRCNKRHPKMTSPDVLSWQENSNVRHLVETFVLKRIVCICYTFREFKTDGYSFRQLVKCSGALSWSWNSSIFLTTSLRVVQILGLIMNLFNTYW